MRRTNIGFLLLLVIVVSTLKAEPKPLLALLDYDAWFPSCGPSLVIYEDGLILYQSPKEISVRNRADYSWMKDFGYRSTRVTDPDVFIRKLFPYEWTALKSKYRLSGATDQRTSLLWHRGQIIEIYGDWRRYLGPNDFGESSTGHRIVEEENALRRALPRGVRELLEGLDRIGTQKDEAWLPAGIPIGLYKYVRHEVPPVAWPSDFPKPKLESNGSDPASVRGALILAGNQYPKFRDFLGRLKYPGVISIENNDYVLTSFEFHVPGEKEWEKDFARKEEQEKAELLREIDKLPPKEREERRKMLGLD